MAAHLIIGVDGGQFLSMIDPPGVGEAGSRGVPRTSAAGRYLAGPQGRRGQQVEQVCSALHPNHPVRPPQGGPRRVPAELYAGAAIDDPPRSARSPSRSTEKQEAQGHQSAGGGADRPSSRRWTRMTSARTTNKATEARPQQHTGPSRPRIGPLLVGPQCRMGHPRYRRHHRRPATGSRAAAWSASPGVRRTDAQDMFLTGRRAQVEAVLLDVEDTPYLAVSLADDPDEDLRVAHGRFLYFAPGRGRAGRKRRHDRTAGTN